MRWRSPRAYGQKVGRGVSDENTKADLEYLASLLRKVEREIQRIRDEHGAYRNALHDAESLVGTAAEELEHNAKREEP